MSNCPSAGENNTYIGKANKRKQPFRFVVKLAKCIKNGAKKLGKQ